MASLNTTDIPENPFGASPSNIPDALTATCLSDAKLARENLLNQSLKDDNAARKIYANRAFYVAIGWLAFLAILLLLQGFGGRNPHTLSVCWRSVTISETNPPIFNLSDSVLIAVISGTTATVIGMLAFVMKYLFPSEPKIKRSNSK